MEEHVSKHWPVWALLLVMGFSFYWVAKSWNSGRVIVSAEESYEMIRPKNFEPQYDLSGRKIVRSLERQRIASLGGPEALRKPLAQKPPTAPAKKTDPKKTAQKTAPKKATLTTRVIPADNKKMSASPDSSNSAQAYYGNNSYAPQNQETAKTNTEKKDDDKISAAQWREILLTRPTVENADKLLAAYKSNQIDSASFYAIADELLSNADKNRQQAGLQLVSKEFAPESFSLMAKHYSDSGTPSDLKASLNSAIQNYGQSGRIAILAKVLTSGDEATIEVATDVIAAAVSVQGNSQTQGDRGGIRSPGSASQIDKTTWLGFLSPLENLTSSSNAGLAERAQSLLESIQALTSV